MHSVMWMLTVTSVVLGGLPLAHREHQVKKSVHPAKGQDDPVFSSDEMLEAVLMASDMRVDEKDKFEEVLNFLTEKFPFRNDLSLHSFAGFAVRLPESIFLSLFLKNGKNMDATISDLRNFFTRTWRNQDKAAVENEFSKLVIHSRYLEDRIRQGDGPWEI